MISYKHSLPTKMISQASTTSIYWSEIFLTHHPSGYHYTSKFGENFLSCSAPVHIMDERTDTSQLTQFRPLSLVLHIFVSSSMALKTLSVFLVDNGIKLRERGFQSYLFAWVRNLP